MSQGKLGAILGLAGLLVSWVAGLHAPPHWNIATCRVDAEWASDGFLVSDGKGGRQKVLAVTMENSALWGLRASGTRKEPGTLREYVASPEGLHLLEARKHWGPWSLLPPALAVGLCFLLREPVISLAAGLASGALLTGRYDLTGQVLIPAIGTPTGATILVLYLWLLGGLMGIWQASGATHAFAQWMAEHVARGPKSSKFAAWLLGMAVFQGGTLSTVLVGSAIRPFAERHRVSREEMSYIVDSTASPVAVLLPFNAWPIYIQSLIFVAGVPILASESERISFFFRCIPLYFYPLLAVLFTLACAMDVFPPAGGGLSRAARRARESGALDRPGALPLLSREFSAEPRAGGHAMDFAIPLALIIGIAVGSFFVLGTPQVLWAFGAALMVAAITALVRGMSLIELMEGFQNGLKGVVYGSVVLLLAVALGGMSRETGGGTYLLSLLPANFPLPALPVLLGLLTMIIAFSTGTSWGTFAVALPLAMPLAWGAAEAGELANPGLFLCVAFAAVINGSLFGDQCSPISDTTVLSSLATGCDLMDHVRTQVGPCLFAAACSLLALAGVAAWLG